ENKVRRLCFPLLHASDLPDSCVLSQWGKWLYEFTPGNAQVRGTDSLNLFYVLDPASVLVAKQFDLSQSTNILDMCSAPGGKGIILAENMNAKAELFLNEFSKDRRDRLTSVVRDHVPNNIRDQIFVKGKDGIRYGMSMPEYFDAILVDAPCSGEKHLVNAPHELEKWSEKRTKRLSAKQYGLLCSALLTAKSGAQIVYSTCSISPYENDGVIERLLARKGEFFDLISNTPDIQGAEKTEYGYQFLPDRDGIGPMYFTKLIKK
ncbi:MAG: hypothetical protein KAG61_13350, partial [Bacteriovoracaceae bacterium]|nr:hypothetical protein [Bacteriovoracaceae bacterium]